MMTVSEKINHQLLLFTEYCDSISLIPDKEELACRSLEFIKKIIQPSFVTLQIFDAGTLKFIEEFSAKPSCLRTLVPSIELLKDVVAAVDRGGELLSLPDEHSGTYLFLFDPEHSPLCDLRIPFFIRNLYIGIFNFGKQAMDEKYLVADIDLLRIFVHHYALAFEILDLRKRMTPAEAPDHQIPALQDSTITLKPHVTFKIRDEDSQLIGQSAVIQRVRELVNKISQEEVPVLITGESGTGKELVARDIHRKSRRAHKTLIAMNCAALPESLVESELFGHEKGAFTGAIYRKLGKFECANDTTLFLDEIADMSLPTQAKVLRVLQDGTFQRVGGNKTLFSDVRLITATNKDMTHLLHQGLFREDLYYRINVVQIHMPPLRDRGEDIAMLAQHFFKYYNEFYRKNLTHIDSTVLNFLLHYSYPGNVRELKNILERAVIMERQTSLTANSISLIGLQPRPTAVETAAGITLEDLEKKHIQVIMDQVHNNKSEAARLLGIARKTLREKLIKYRIQ
jgi:transcriptional regulator with GAF, ATPase, and Fis domain